MYGSTHYFGNKVRLLLLQRQTDFHCYLLDTLFSLYWKWWRFGNIYWDKDKKKQMCAATQERCFREVVFFFQLFSADSLQECYLMVGCSKSSLYESPYGNWPFLVSTCMQLVRERCCPGQALNVCWCLGTLLKVTPALPWKCPNISPAARPLLNFFPGCFVLSKQVHDFIMNDLICRFQENHTCKKKKKFRSKW